MELNMTELIKYTIENYGVIGFALLFWIYQGREMTKKMDRLQGSCNKMFGIMLALSDKRSRETNSDSGGLLDD